MAILLRGLIAKFFPKKEATIPKKGIAATQT